MVTITNLNVSCNSMSCNSPRAEGHADIGETLSLRRKTEVKVLTMVRTLVTSIAFSLFLSTTCLVFQSGALALAESAYQEQVAPFTQKLEEARSTQADLKHLVVCLDRRDADLIQQRTKLEGRLGVLRTDERNLAPKVQALEAAYQQYKVNFEVAQKKADELKKTIENMPGRELHERHKRDCASKNRYDQIACGRRMGRDFFGNFERMEGQLNGALRSEQIARGSMNGEKKSLDDSQLQLTATRGQLDSVVQEIGQIEIAIGSVKQTLSNVRELVQPVRVVIEAFTDALNEAKDVNLADERPRSLRKLGDIAAAMVATMARGRGAVSHADEILGAGWIKSCSVN